MGLEPKTREAVEYEDENGDSPYESWISSLRDVTGRAKIAGRINRAAKGNFGDHANLGDGLWELRFIGKGPGYRVYFTIDKNDTIILLMGGGIKKSQSKDIEAAKKLLQDHKKEN